MEDGYRSLAAAIILQAVKDFKKAAKRYKAGKRKEESLREMQEVIKFVKSEWFKVLTDLDPEIVIKKLKEELDDDI